jgi:hypothetical protein
VGPRAGLDAMAKRKISRPHRESKSVRSDRPACSLVAIPALHCLTYIYSMCTTFRDLILRPNMTKVKIMVKLYKVKR